MYECRFLPSVFSQVCLHAVCASDRFWELKLLHWFVVKSIASTELLYDCIGVVLWRSPTAVMLKICGSLKCLIFSDHLVCLWALPLPPRFVRFPHGWDQTASYCFLASWMVSDLRLCLCPTQRKNSIVFHHLQWPGLLLWKSCLMLFCLCSGCTSMLYVGSGNCWSLWAPSHGESSAYACDGSHHMCVYVICL